MNILSVLLIGRHISVKGISVKPNTTRASLCGGNAGSNEHLEDRTDVPRSGQAHHDTLQARRPSPANFRRPTFNRTWGDVLELELGFRGCSGQHLRDEQAFLHHHRD